jgi:hypothetical protein
MAQRAGRSTIRGRTGACSQSGRPTEFVSCCSLLALQSRSPRCSGVPLSILLPGCPGIRRLSRQSRMPETRIPIVGQCSPRPLLGSRTEVSSDGRPLFFRALAGSSSVTGVDCVEHPTGHELLRRAGRGRRRRQFGHPRGRSNETLTEAFAPDEGVGAKHDLDDALIGERGGERTEGDRAPRLALGRGRKGGGVANHG